MIFLLIMVSCMSNKFVVKGKGFRSLERAVMIDDREDFKRIVESKDLTFYEDNKDILERIIELEEEFEKDLSFYIEELIYNQANPFIENDKYRELIEFGKYMAILFVEDSEKILEKKDIEEIINRRYKENSILKILLSKMEKEKLIKILKKIDLEDTIEVIHLVVDSKKEKALEVLCEGILNEDNIELLWSKSLDKLNPIEKLIKNRELGKVIEILKKRYINLKGLLNAMNNVEKIVNFDYEGEDLDEYLNFCIDNSLGNIIRIITNSERVRGISKSYKELGLELKEELEEDQYRRLKLIVKEVKNMEDEEELMCRLTEVRIKGESILTKLISEIEEQRVEELLNYKNNFFRKIIIEADNKNILVKIINILKEKIGYKLEEVITKGEEDLLKEVIDASDKTKILLLIDCIKDSERLERALVEIKDIEAEQKKIIRKKILTKLTESLK